MNKLLESNLLNVDNIFSEIIRTGDAKISNKLTEELFDMFHKNIYVACIYPDVSTTFYGMCVFPDKSDIDKIIDAIMTDKPNSNLVKDIWKKADNWNIEIDMRLISDISLTARELTALLLHEIGHIMISDSIPNKISVIVGLEYSKLAISKKAMLRTDIFKPLLRLPVINACTPKLSKDLRLEVRADKFCIKCGYQNELVSALKKISTLAVQGTQVDDIKSMQDGIKLSSTILDQLEARQSIAVHNTFDTIKKKIPSSWISDQLEVLQQRYGKVGNLPKELNTVPTKRFESSISQVRRDEFYNQMIEKIRDDSYLTEFVIGLKKLKRIEPADIDYIELQINDIKTNDDKLMLTSYLHSKLDMVQYYLALLRSGNKHYVVPHSEEYLVALENRLYRLKEQVLQAKLPEVKYGLTVGYPEGYEG